MKNAHGHPHAAAPAVSAAPAGPWDQAAFAARLILGLVFLYSGFHKAVQPAEEFAVVIEAYNILSPSDSLTAARVVPWIEVFTGAFLITGFLARAAAAVGGSMLAMFMFALLSAIIRRVPLENCGCFGKSIHLTPPQAIMMDAALFLMAIIAYKRGRRLLSLDNWVEQGE